MLAVTWLVICGRGRSVVDRLATIEYLMAQVFSLQYNLLNVNILTPMSVMSSQAVYHDVNCDASDASSTELGEALNSEKVEWEVQYCRPSRHRLWTLARSSWWAVDTILLLIILALVVEPRWPRMSSKFETNGDVTGFAPHCKKYCQHAVHTRSLTHPVSQQITTFKPDLGFVPENTSDFWNDEVRRKWLGIVPSKSTSSSISTGETK